MVKTVCRVVVLGLLFAFIATGVYLNRDGLLRHEETSDNTPQPEIEITTISEAVFDDGFVQDITCGSIKEVDFFYDTFTANDAKGVIEEAVFSEESDETKNREGFAVPARANKPINGFLDISFNWKQGEIEQSAKLFFHDLSAYAFLPSYVKLDHITLTYDENAYAVSLDGKPVENASALAKLVTTRDYDLEICYKGNDSEDEYGYYLLRVMKSENLPAIFVNTANGTMEYLNQSKSNYESGDMVCIDAEGKLDLQSDIQKIHLRGSTSAGAIQKSYTIVTENSIEILGLKPANKFCFIGSGYDATRMRNALSYSLAQDLGLKYAIKYQFVDVYYNREYSGTTILTESVEVAENRIDPEDAQYLLKVDRFGEDEPFYFTAGGMTMQVVYPDVPQRTDVEQLRDKIDTICQKINLCDTKERFDDLCNSVDMDSFAKKYIINALANEVDSNWLSTYYYWSEDKLYAAPVWDFDRAYGDELNGRGFDYRVNSFGNGPTENLMLVSSSFQKYVRDVALNHTTAFSSFKLNLERFVKRCRRSLDMTYARYPSLMIYFADFGNVESNINYLQYTLEQRTNLILDTIIHPEKYHRIILNGRIVWLEDGHTLSEELIDSMKTICGVQNITYSSGGLIRYDIPIHSDLVLRGS